jgi:hypothetical protein
MFYLNRKNKALAALKTAQGKYKSIGSIANSKAISLYCLRKDCSVAIYNVEAYLTSLANTPQNYKKEVADVQLCIKDFNHAVTIENDYKSNKIKEASLAVGAAGGTAIAALGPTAAMTIATTFGTASTGTAIASLSGAAATNAALAWLGGGAIAAGGGGMAAGEFFLALAGPIGWGIAGALGVGGGILAIRNNKKTAEKAEAMLCEINPKIADLERKLQELSNLYTETEKLSPAIDINNVCKDFPMNYCDFTDDQKLKLGSLINSTIAMGKLINRKIY